MLSLNIYIYIIPCSLSSWFFCQSYHCDHLAWGRENLSICFSCICMFILHPLLFVFLSSSRCRGLAAACDCSTPWTFHLTVKVFLKLFFQPAWVLGRVFPPAVLRIRQMLVGQPVTWPSKHCQLQKGIPAFNPCILRTSVNWVMAVHLILYLYSACEIASHSGGHRIGPFF